MPALISHDYLKLPYSRILIPDEDGSFSAEILEFPGCFAEGATAGEAMTNLESAAEAWIEAALALGQEIPEPQMNQGYGGKIALRLPRSLHRQAARMAEHEGTSLNQFLATAVAARVGAEEFYARLVESLKRQFISSTTNVYMTVGTTQPPMRVHGPGLKVVSSPTETLQLAANNNTMEVALYAGS